MCLKMQLNYWGLFSFVIVRRKKIIMSACLVSSGSGFFFSEAGQEPGPTASCLNSHSPPRDTWGSNNKKRTRNALKGSRKCCHCHVQYIYTHTHKKTWANFKSVSPASLLLLLLSSDQIQYCFFIIVVVALLIPYRVHHLQLEHRERRVM